MTMVAYIISPTVEILLYQHGHEQTVDNSFLLIFCCWNVGKMSFSTIHMLLQKSSTEAESLSASI